jgi:peptidylprolyl isomerase
VDTTGNVPPPTVLIEWDYLQRLGPRPLLVLDTRHGAVVVEMDTEQAPQTVMKLAKTAVLGHYDGVPFHRVVPNFVVQGGDYFRGDGYGGPDVNLRSEFTRLRYATGVAGMASAGKDTEGVQYFVTHSPQPHLDGRYTAFGRVVAGMEVLDRLQPGDVVTRARVVRTDERH